MFKPYLCSQLVLTLPLVSFAVSTVMCLCTPRPSYSQLSSNVLSKLADAVSRNLTWWLLIFQPCPKALSACFRDLSHPAQRGYCSCHHFLIHNLSLPNPSHLHHQSPLSWHHQHIPHQNQMNFHSPLSTGDAELFFELEHGLQLPWDTFGPCKEMKKISLGRIKYSPVYWLSSHGPNHNGLILYIW